MSDKQTARTIPAQIRFTGLVSDKHVFEVRDCLDFGHARGPGKTCGIELAAQAWLGELPRSVHRFRCDKVRMERSPYSKRYHLFRLVAHLAKYWTTEFAIDTAKWAMEVHGGLGVLVEYRVKRWLREAMILGDWRELCTARFWTFWVMKRKQAHKMLFEHLKGAAAGDELQETELEIQRHLNLPPDEKEANAEAIFKRLAVFTADKAFAKGSDIGQNCTGNKISNVPASLM